MLGQLAGVTQCDRDNQHDKFGSMNLSWQATRYPAKSRRQEANDGKLLLTVCIKR